MIKRIFYIDCANVNSWKKCHINKFITSIKKNYKLNESKIFIVKEQGGYPYTLRFNLPNIYLIQSKSSPFSYPDSADKYILKSLSTFSKKKNICFYLASRDKKLIKSFILTRHPNSNRQTINTILSGTRYGNISYNINKFYSRTKLIAY